MHRSTQRKEVMKIIKSIVTPAVLATLLVAASAASADSIKVENVWARASAGKAAAGGAFMTVHNVGGAERMVAAESDVASRVELHTHLMEGGMMKMTKVDAIPVPAGGMTALKPGGYHVMFMGLKAPFKEGTSFPLTLVFEKAGKIKVMVSVKAVGAMSGNMGHNDMKMEHGSMQMGQ